MLLEENIFAKEEMKSIIVREHSRTCSRLYPSPNCFKIDSALNANCLPIMEKKLLRILYVTLCLLRTNCFSKLNKLEQKL